MIVDKHCFDITIVYDSRRGTLMEFDEYEIIGGACFPLPLEEDEIYAHL